jgi:serine/threonine protein kinase/Tol biopolymer transport system component
MTLPAGTKVGAFEIAGSLGAGGMGEVYRAHDPKLGRDVAIKVLPGAFLENPERRARFEREARVLASINHPHIGAIYGVEDAEGYRALVLELIEGETLADRISAAGRLPVDEALGIARQIADALEAAHEKGIVHRDLKPANIMLNEAGAVKVVDFGLARLDAGDTSGSSIANSPTLTYAGTVEGVILGTAVYLSPEQARGRSVDKRTDIWAFGCVLYEMLTGQRVFGRETVSDSIAAILGQEPDWSALPKEVPERIEHLLRRCLTKDPRRRLHDIADARIDIEDTLASPLPVRRPATESPGIVSELRGAPAWLPWVLFGSATAALIIVSWFAFISSRGGEPETRGAITFSLMPPGPVVFAPTSNFVAVSPNGRYIAFVAYNVNGLPYVWIRAIDSLDGRPLPGSENGRHPFWSPDSRQVGFFAAGGVVRRVPVDGGPAQTLASTTSTMTGATWNRDGTILLSSVQGPIRRIAASGGAAASAVTIVRPGEQVTHSFPFFLPDGKRFLFYVRSADPEKDGIYITSLDGEEPSVVVRASSSVTYVPSGHLLYVRDGVLLAHPFDVSTARVTADPVVAAEKVDYFPETGMGAFSASDNGVLVYRNSAQTAVSRLVWFDRTGKRIGELGEPAPYRNPRLSPDGKRVAVELVDATGNRDVWIFDVARGAPVRFTFDPGRDASPAWSSDGRYIVWQGSTSMYIKSADGLGGEQRLSDDAMIPDEWLPDGSGLLCHPPSPRQILFMAWPGQDRTLRKMIEGRAITTQARVTRDGKWVAFATSDSGRFEVMIQDYPKASGRWQVSTNGGLQPKWRADGKELFYLTLDARLVAVPVTLGTLPQIEKPQNLFQTQAEVITGYTWHQYDVTPDGQRFLVNTGEIVVTPVTVVHDWPELIRSRR